MSENWWFERRWGRRSLLPVMGAGLVFGAAAAHGAAAAPQKPEKGAGSAAAHTAPAGQTGPSGSASSAPATATTASPPETGGAPNGDGNAKAGGASNGQSDPTPNGKTSTPDARTSTTAPSPPDAPGAPATASALPAASAPVPGRSVASAAIGGKVLVRIPGAPQEVPLSAAAQLPVGAVIDARQGAVGVVAAVNRKGTDKVGFFGGAEFVVEQSSGAQPLTTLRLAGGSFAACADSGSDPRATAQRVVRQLWSAESGGRVETVGHAGSASAQAAVWLTQDRCGGTLYSVSKGKVTVHDHGHAFALQAGQSHLVPAALPASLPRPSRPVPGASVTSALLGGKVTVRLPGQKKALPLTAAAQLPVGAVVDARQGAIGVVAAVNHAGATKTGFFAGSEFVVGQTRGVKPLTTLKLTGGSFAGCPATGTVHGPLIYSSRRRSRRQARRVIRQLWGADSGGRFQTIGRSASAAVRGTVWLTQDRCDGTYFYVRKGEIIVHDPARHRNIPLHAGHGYLVRRG